MRGVHRGSTLIEALVALAVLGIGLAGAARYLGQVFRCTAEARAHTQALALAETEIDRFRSLASYRAFRSGTQQGIHWYHGIQRVYRIHWKFSPLRGQALGRLEIHVRWTEPDGPAGLRLGTFISLQEPERLAGRLQ